MTGSVVPVICVFLFCSDVKRDQIFKTEMEIKPSKPRPKFWFLVQFGLETNIFDKTWFGFHYSLNEQVLLDR